MFSPTCIFFNYLNLITIAVPARQSVQKSLGLTMQSGNLRGEGSFAES
jgi:hypothetical protein